MPAGTSVSQPAPDCRAVFRACDYDLAATLSSGQAFRWHAVQGGWEGVILGRWVRLHASGKQLCAQTAVPGADWRWLTEYLRLGEDLRRVLRTLPKDAPLQAAVRACRGLRLLRQEPWECLASFILSSAKRIVHIQQAVALLCERYGQAVAAPPGHRPEYSFPTAATLAACSERELRACGIGFRAPFLREAARQVDRGELDLAQVAGSDLETARRQLMQLPGVGRKIADCVLLFALGFTRAFPVDVWVAKALRELYFSGQSITLAKLLQFSDSHFGPYGGYAQQYLYHYMRTTRSARPLAKTAN
jgi:N-glycosylase/DNA lyase